MFCQWLHRLVRRLWSRNWFHPACFSESVVWSGSMYTLWKPVNWHEKLMRSSFLPVCSASMFVVLCYQSLAFLLLFLSFHLMIYFPPVSWAVSMWTPWFDVRGCAGAPNAVDNSGKARADSHFWWAFPFAMMVLISIFGVWQKCIRMTTASSSRTPGFCGSTRVTWTLSKMRVGLTGCGGFTCRYVTFDLETPFVRCFENVGLGNGDWAACCYIASGGYMELQPWTELINCTRIFESFYMLSNFTSLGASATLSTVRKLKVGGLERFKWLAGHRGLLFSREYAVDFSSMASDLVDWLRGLSCTHGSLSPDVLVFLWFGASWGTRQGLSELMLSSRLPSWSLVGFCVRFVTITQGLSVILLHVMERTTHFDTCCCKDTRTGPLGRCGMCFGGMIVLSGMIVHHRQDLG